LLESKIVDRIAAMTTPPEQVDSAFIVAYVALDPAVQMNTEALRLYADGASQTSFYGLLIATYDLASFYLFFCDAHWETENDTFHNSVLEAMETAALAFGVTPSQWHFFIDELRPE
jgi:hypothetical protein